MHEMRTEYRQAHEPNTASGAAGPAPLRRERFFAAILRRRRLVYAVYLAAVIVSALMWPHVGVDYDFDDYLPKDAPSTVALHTLESQFGDAVPNVRAMLEDVSVAQALDYKARIEAVEGVTKVTWLDDVLDLGIPLEVQDQQTVEAYYKDGDALFSVTVDDARGISAVQAIRDIVGANGALAGSEVATAVSTTSTVREIGVITVLAVAVCLLVLIVTTRSWLEPFVVLTGLGAAVVINAGTNLVFGEISFVTNAAGSILQLAISLDFSVFMLHRFNECRGLTPSVQGDMALALSRSSTAILSSACTVMMGFLALTAMQFRIGADLGFALAKGIAISLVTVFTLTACLLVSTDGSVQASQHRAFVPSMGGFARFVSHVCIPAAVLLALVAFPAHQASVSGANEFYYGSSHIFGPSTQLGKDQQRIDDTFGYSDTYVLMVPRGNMGAEAALLADLEALPQVTSVISYPGTVGPFVPQAMVPATKLSQLESASYSRMVLQVDAAYEGDATFALVERVREIAGAHYPGTYLLAGEGVSTTDLRDTIVSDKRVVDLIAVGAVVAVLLLATRSLVLPLLLVLVIEACIWINFAVPYFTDAAQFYLAYLVVSTIQLGVTVDYAILLADRYKEERRTRPKVEALRASVAACTVSIMTSGTVLAVSGFLIGAFSANGVLAQLGTYLGIGTLISLVGVLVALPGFLRLFDAVIARTTLHARFLGVGTPSSPADKPR